MTSFSITKVLNDLNVEFGRDDRDVFAYAPDLARALRYARTSDMMKLVGSQEKGAAIRRTLGGSQKTTIVYRYGILELVFRSTLPNAVAVKRQVMEILRELESEGFVLDDDRLTRDRAARERLDARVEGIRTRVAFTDVLKDVYDRSKTSQPFEIWAVNFTTMMTTKVLGISAREFKERKKGGNFRDVATADELQQIEAAERVVVSRYLRHGTEGIKALYHDAKTAMDVFE